MPSTESTIDTCQKRSDRGRRPTFEELPFRNQRDPKASAWGLWGPDDELGTLNLLQPHVVSAAAQEIQLGITTPLNLPLNVPVLPMNPTRKSCSHNIVAKGYANDDETEIYLNTQSSSHWDGLRHYPYQGGEEPLYYNGVTQSDISGPKANGKIGIQSKLSAKTQPAAIVLTRHTDIARSAITGRGVLLDWRRWALDNGIRYSPFESHAIPLEQLQAVAIEEKVTFRTGDILLIRSGWTEEYRKLGERDKIALARRKDRRFVGVEASREMIKWHWDNRFAAVAGDTNAYEVWPPTKPDGVALHEVFLSGWGMPIGEVWDLEALAACCNRLKRWSFFLSSTPLNLEGGVASPANAVAIS